MTEPLIGAVLLVVGLVLYLTTGDVHTPVVTLTKVGLVLMVVGGAEIVVALARLVFGRRGRSVENS
ncbi:hypothetical protein BU204_23390 [Actinophytocola xanthii]|uniref:Uncharacterized protein n=1 Tax=Actinophytocola xanthii TaxID=1912961 RepID=A0A1Q8CLG6_9PSEU|nr:hypothetical protein BU204_23390 [Actinophytocola xanthii]